MKTITKILLVTLGLGALGIGVNEFAKHSERKRAAIAVAEKDLRSKLEEESPFSQTPVEVKRPKRGIRPWYQEIAFVPLKDHDIVYEKKGNLFLAKDGIEKDSTKIARDIRLKKKHLFAYDMTGSGNPDVYFINKESQLRKLSNKGSGEFEDAGVVHDLSPYFSKIPKHSEIGDVDCDGIVDLIFQDTIELGPGKGKAIFVLYGNKPEDKIALFYLGKGVKGLIARDVDGDGDTDIIFKRKEERRKLYGLENETKQNAAVFAGELERRVGRTREFFF
jgi:hypothetical protein